MLMLFQRSNIQVQAFQKDAIEFLISDKKKKKKKKKNSGRIRTFLSDKDIFETQLREMYIMMILCDTEIRTYVLLKKGQTAVAWKKVGLPRFSCGTSKFEG